MGAGSRTTGIRVAPPPDPPAPPRLEQAASSIIDAETSAAFIIRADSLNDAILPPDRKIQLSTVQQDISVLVKTTFACYVAAFDAACGDGSVSEWFKEPVLKTGDGESRPWVRIPPLPPAEPA